MEGADGPLRVTLFGSAALLTPICLRLSESIDSERRRYGIIAAAGAVLGALLLGIFSPDRIGFWLLGALYGFATAAAWAAIHRMTRRWGAAMS